MRITSPSRRQRRTRSARLALVLLALLGLAVGAACGGNEPPADAGFEVAPGTPTASATPTTPVPTASPNASGTAATTPVVPPEIAFDPAPVGQGEATTVVVRQAEASTAAVTFLGERYPLIRAVQEPDVFWAVLPVSVTQALGDYDVAVSTRDRLGNELSSVSATVEVEAVERPVDYLETTPSVAAVLTVDAQEVEDYLHTFEQYNSFSGRPLWDGLFLVPCEGFVTTEFGQGRSINGGPVGGFHGGMDIGNDEGTPIHASARGRVAWVGAMPIHGNSVLIDHGAGVMTGYHHLLDYEVEVGQMVEAGDEIAHMGTTGFSTGPHLHWELTIYGVNVDPLTWTEREFGADTLDSRSGG